MAFDTLVDKGKLEAALTATATAIRAKTGDSATIGFDMNNNKGFADAVDAIPSGGGADTYKLTIRCHTMFCNIDYSDIGGHQYISEIPVVDQGAEPVVVSDALCGAMMYVQSVQAIRVQGLTSRPVGSGSKGWLLIPTSVGPGDEVTLDIYYDD